jgi:predicted HicB family RNase H-like nuclease
VIVLESQGYRASVVYDEEDKVFVGHLLGINDIVVFHGDSVEALKQAIKEAVTDYVETYGRTGKVPEQPEPVR